MNPGRVVCSARDCTFEANDLVPTAPSQQSNNCQHIFSGSQLPVSCSLPHSNGNPSCMLRPGPGHTRARKYTEKIEYYTEAWPWLTWQSIKKRVATVSVVSLGLYLTCSE